MDTLRAKELVVENNHQFIIANKPGGIPVQPDKTGDKSLLEIIQPYAKAKLHLFNRLDRPVSGLVIFSKKNTATRFLQREHEKGKIVKSYLAIVEGKYNGLEELNHFHIRDGARKRALITEKLEEGYSPIKLGVKIHKELERYTILELSLTSGKFHQIRSQLAHVGFAIKGDVKYGARRKNKDRCIYLHAYKIGFAHPVSKKVETFKSDPPKDDNLWKLVDVEA